MNQMSRLGLPVTLLVATMLALSGCSQEPAEPPPLKGAAIGGPFTLVDQNGQQTRDSDFEGKYRLIYFGYTFCPDVCPLDMQQISQALRAFEKQDAERAAMVQPIFISVDPQRDKPPVVKEFISNFHPRFVGLTGTEEQLAAAAKHYGVYYSKRETRTEKQKEAHQHGGGDSYLMDHSRTTVLFGPSGEPIAPLPNEQGGAAIAAELERWVK